MPSKLRLRFQGLIGLVLIAALVAVLLGMYQKVFTPVVTVTVHTDRAGLLLDKGSAVRAFGVRIGEVRSTRVVDGDSADVLIAIDQDQAKNIPSDVTASIRATTVFGAKFVDLQVPDGSVTTPIASGQTIQASGATVEVNDVFQHALKLIDTVEPAELNQTLTAMAKALDGRGEKLGELLSASNDYLGAVDEHLPQVTSDLQRANGVVRTYADVTPQLLDIARQATTTSKTISSQAATLHTLLVDLTTASGQVGTFLTGVEHPLVNALTQLTPVTALAKEYAPEYGCLISGLASHNKRISAAFGHQAPGSQALSGFLPAQTPYRYPQNLPKLVSGIGPKCYYYPADTEGGTFTHIDFNDGSAGIYTLNTGPSLKDPVTFYTDSAKSFLGDAGFTALIQNLIGAKSKAGSQ